VQCVTTNRPDTNSNPNPNTEQQAIVNIQLNIVMCPTYPDKFIRDNVVGVAQWLGCRSVAGGLSLIYA